MSRMSLIFAMLFVFLSLSFAQGSMPATAVSVSPNGSAGGAMSDASTNHYWKVTTTANGYLRVQITSASTIDIDVTSTITMEQPTLPRMAKRAPIQRYSDS